MTAMAMDNACLLETALVITTLMVTHVILAQQDTGEILAKKCVLSVIMAVTKQPDLVSATIQTKLDRCVTDVLLDLLDLLVRKFLLLPF
jgi:hypothetical protein